MSVLCRVFTYSPLTTVQPFGPSLLRRCQPARSLPLNSDRHPSAACRLAATVAANTTTNATAMPTEHTTKTQRTAARASRALWFVVSLMRFDSGFGEHVLVLAIAHDQRSFAVAPPDYEFEPGQRGIDGDERDAAVVIYARRDGTFPLADVEHGGAAFLPDRHVTERRVSVPRSELGNLCTVGRHGQPLALLGDRGLHLSRRG